MGALLGTQNGREVEIVNTFELAVEADGITVDQGFFVARREQCALFLFSLSVSRCPYFVSDKQVFPSIEFIGWYTVALHPTAKHIALHEQVCKIDREIYCVFLNLTEL